MQLYNDTLPFELKEMQAIKQDFWRQIEKGVDGHPRSLAMLPTQLEKLSTKYLQEGSRALVIDVGGSCLKFGVLKVINAQPQAQGEFREVPFEKTKWQAQEFFAFIADKIQSIDITRIQGIGFIFSFPGQTVKTAKGVDVQVFGDKLTKDWQITGLTKGGPVGEQLISALGKFNHLPLVVMNDTVAVLFSDPKAVVAGVVGTGFNLAVMIKNKVWNTEAGNFTSPTLPLTHLTQTFDATTQNPGQQLAEKQISGLGIGGQLKEFIKRHPEGHIDPNKVSAITASNVLLEKENLLFPLCKVLRDRSAQILACFLAAIGEKSQLHNLIIPIDGSFFWKTPEYRKILTHYLSILNPLKTYSFFGEDTRLGAIGAARVVLDSNKPNILSSLAFMASN